MTILTDNSSAETNWNPHLRRNCQPCDGLIDITLTSRQREPLAWRHGHDCDLA